ncbi:MAG: type VI secretion system-associated protein [Beggiatoa sp. IS2]|nr:MAG: type VI secretion system-associated protein [Beggiatoa sp. IS2]
MPTKESTQHKLDRVRPPRVQITYDVETGGALELKELPFVVGVLSDLSGQPENPLPPLKERRFVEIDRDNFNEVMASITPRLALRVDNRLTAEDSKLNVLLNFKSLDDFHPSNILKQVEPLRKLFEVRQRLNDLLVKLDGNDDLDKLLQSIITNTDELQTIQKLAQTTATPSQGSNGASDSPPPSETPAAT